MANRYGTGTLRKRGNTWHVLYWVDGVQRQKSSKSSKIQDAKKLQDQILVKTARGEMGHFAAGKVTCGELLDDALAHVKATGKAYTAKVWSCVIEANLRPHFGHLRAAKLTTEKIDDYRDQRLRDGRSESTANREISILRTAFHWGRKCSPPKVLTVPYFPMSSEVDNIRQGFLKDEDYSKLKAAFSNNENWAYLLPLLVVACWTGIRKGELNSIRVNQVDL